MAAAKTYAFLQAFLPAYLEDGQGVDLDLGLDDQSTEEGRASKRARSIQAFVDQASDDSEEDGSDHVLCGDDDVGADLEDLGDDDDGAALGAGSMSLGLGPLHPASLDHEDPGVVPATPVPVTALRPGALTPSFCTSGLGRGSSAASGHGPADRPSKVQTSCAYVAVCEEANSLCRPYMEDRAAHIQFDGVLYVGCFDGHGGTDASCYLQAHLLRNIHARLQPGCDVHDVLHTAYGNTNASFRQTGSIHGSTATTCIINGPRLICANVGDSPAFVIMRSGEVFNITAEHKIDGAELARVTAFGAPIYRNLGGGPTYMGTADGTRWLNMSRAFGDFCYDAISCEPHVCAMDVADARFLVMGSDGLTEKWPLAAVASYVSQLAKHGHGLQAICQRLVERAIARGSTDNITAIVVDLEAYQVAQQQQPLAAQAVFSTVAMGGVSACGGLAAAAGGVSTDDERDSTATAVSSPLSDDTGELL